MNLALGAGFLTVTVLLFSWAYGTFRTANPIPESTNVNEFVVVTLSVILTGLFAMTCAFAVATALEFTATMAELDAVYISVIAVCAALCWFLPNRIIAYARSGQKSPTGTSPEGTVSTFPAKGGGRKKGAAAPDRHRKAA